MGRRRANDGAASEPLSQYHEFLRQLKETGLASGTLTKIPPDLIDFVADFITAFLAVTGMPEAGAQERLVFLNFIKRTLHKAQISCSAMILAVLYLHRLSQQHGPVQLDISAPVGCAEFLVAMMLADKYLYDNSYANKFWASINGRYSQQQLNDMERNALALLDYNLFVSEHTYDEFLTRLQTLLNLKRVAHKPVLNYSDLYVLLTQLPSHPLFTQYEALLVVIRAVVRACAVYTALAMVVYVVVQQAAVWGVAIHVTPLEGSLQLTSTQILKPGAQIYDT